MAASLWCMPLVLAKTNGSSVGIGSAKQPFSGASEEMTDGGPGRAKGASGCLWAAVGAVVAGGLAFALLVGTCAYRMYDGFAHMPDDARREILYPRYKATLDGLAGVLPVSGSVDAVRDSLRSLLMHEDVLLIILNVDGGGDEIVYQKLNLTGRGYYARQGAGYGHVRADGEKIPAFVVQGEGRLADGRSVDTIVYLRDVRAERRDDAQAPAVEAP